MIYFSRITISGICDCTFIFYIYDTLFCFLIIFIIIQGKGGMVVSPVCVTVWNHSEFKFNAWQKFVKYGCLLSRATDVQRLGKATSNNCPNYGGPLFSHTCVTLSLRFLHNLICLTAGNSTVFHFVSIFVTDDHICVKK